MEEEKRLRPGDEYLPMLDNLASMVWRSDLDGSCDYFNKSWLEFTGRTLEQEAGAGWMDAIHPEDLPRVTQAYLEAIHAGLPYRLEYRLRHASGAYRWILTVGQPFLGAQGELAGYLGTGFDQSGQKMTEQALQESEAMFKGLFEFSPDAVIAVNQKGIILLVNQQAEEMFGYPREGLVGQPIEKLMPAGFQARHRGHLKSYVSRPRVRPMGVRLSLLGQRKDGSPFPVDITLGPLETSQGLVILSTIRDITGRKAAEEQIRQQTARLQSLAEISQSLAEVESDYQRVVETMARQTADLTGDACVVTLLSADGQHLQPVAFHHPDPEADQVLRQVLAGTEQSVQEGLAGQVVRTGQALRVTSLSDQPVGAQVPPRYQAYTDNYPIHSILIAPLRAQGQTLGTLGISRSRPEAPAYTSEDQTFLVDLATRAALAIANARLFQAVQTELGERKRAEDDLRLYKDNLEELVTARTSELQLEIERRKHADTSLQSYARQLNRSNRELQDFASIASHDLQEPLRKIQAFGERLSTRYRDVLGIDGNDFLDRMLNATVRMQRLLNDLLAYSRVTTKAQPLVPVSLEAVVAGVLSDLEIRIEETRGTVEVDPLPTVEADELQMQQLFQNLIGNALKFHRPGVPPVVQIRAQICEERDSLGDEKVQIEIQDNGIGFDEQYLERIFQPFQRLHNSQEYEGTGIGLAICRKIVERHNGTITASSQPGKGTTFLISLPTRISSGKAKLPGAES